MEFFNIDLDLVSESDLSSIVCHFEKEVAVMCNEVREGRHYVSFETGHVSPIAIIQCYSRLVAELGPDEKSLWEACTSRVFDFGYEEAELSRSRRAIIPEKQVEAIAKIGGEIAVTIYSVKEEELRNDT